ncbi:MAG: type VII secretion protein EccB, partial [Nocardioides sp.]|nr:type VII secretion protein EccB [Nocardioides sp.]
MATKKDLVEAYSFSRRRLVTAFVSGAPGGREVEPSRPGRTIIGGLALAVLLCAGAAIAGVFKPDVDIDWEKPGLILSKEKGAAFVILEPDEDGNHQVRPVINVTSAQLILGEDATPEVVPQAEIDEKDLGPDIGILGAPVTVPDTGDLIETGWTACTDDGRGTRFSVMPEPDVDP